MATETASIAELFNQILVDNYLDKEYVKAELQNIGPTNAVRYLSKILAQDQRKLARLMAAFALGSTGDVSAIPPLVQSLTQETDPEVRSKAAYELGQIRLADAIPFLVQVLGEDKDELVRGTAASSLGEIGLPEAIPALIKALPVNEGRSASMIIQALGKIGDPKAIPILATALDDFLDSGLRSNVIYALQAIKHIDAVSPLGKALTTDASWLNREAALEALAGMGYDAAFPYLSLALTEDENADVRQKAAIALGTVAQDQSVPVLKECLIEDENENVRAAAAEALGLICHIDGVITLCQALETDPSENVCCGAALSLGKIGDVTAIPVLSKVLSQNKSIVTRLGIIQALAEIDHVDTVTPLVKALLEDDEFEARRKAAIVLQAKTIIDWQAKSTQIVQALEQGKQQRSDIQAPTILLAMQPPHEQLDANSHLRTDFLIGQALDQDDRMTAILAKLIIDSASESVLLAGERINDYEKTHQTPPDKFRKLRIEIGGETALDPIMQVLQNDLKTHFQTPISELNLLTQNNWQKTVLYAQYGFLARITMSIVVFIVGMILLSISSLRIMFGQLDQAQLFGAGISFVSGLGSMLLIIYRGPLREIRDSVNDLGIASAAFIAYIHRVLQISHTFSFHYLKQQIGFDDLKKSSKLIEDAMDDTIAKFQAHEANKD